MWEGGGGGDGKGDAKVRVGKRKGELFFFSPGGQSHYSGRVVSVKQSAC